jgi:transcription initiation factor TFIIIB Brf1 subunit/transcription initiation factor TFIIB
MSSNSEFLLFDQLLQEYKKINVSDEETTEGSDSDCCLHENIINEKGMSICVDCGEEMQYKNTHDKEWRYYGQGDTKNSSDPTRVQMRKCEERNIFRDVENLGFSDKVVARANKIYAQVTKGKIFRGNSRRAIVFASIFHSFKLGGHPQSHERLIRIFNLNRKTGLRGLKYVNLYAPKDSKIRTTYISPVNLVEEILEQFSATKEQKQEVIDLYEKIKNKSSRLNRSRPQSVSSGLVFYWTCIKGKNISLKEFAKKVQLSELTISKIAKEISEVLETVPEQTQEEV